MVIKNSIDIENLCNCREAREWGRFARMASRWGLHWLKAQQPESLRHRRHVPPCPSGKASRPRCSGRLPANRPNCFVILPPNLDQAIARGKVMLVFEAKWGGGRCPLNALPKGRPSPFRRRTTRSLIRSKR